MDQDLIFTKLWETIDLTSDWIKFGFKEEHNTPEIELKENSSEEIVNEKNNKTQILNRVSNCENCEIVSYNRKPIEPYGISTAQLYIIAPPPTKEAEEENNVFSKDDFEFLGKWISSINMEIGKNIRILNVVKCRPAGNRKLLSREIENCKISIIDEIDKNNPSIILFLGLEPLMLYNDSINFDKARGSVFEFMGAECLVSYPPGAVLQNPALKRPVWEDLKILKQLVDSKGIK